MKIYFEESDIIDIWVQVQDNLHNKIKVAENKFRMAKENGTKEYQKEMLHQIDLLRTHSTYLNAVRQDFMYELNATIKQ